MKIAICDDEIFALEAAVTCVENYIFSRRTEIEYAAFDNYFKLEPRIDEFDIFLMDYQTPEIDGMTFAKKIREKYGEKKAIIFITSYQEIVFDAFSVRALRFLTKPLDEEKLFEALDAYMKNNVVTNHFVFKSENGDTIVSDTDDVYFIEADGKNSTVHLKDKVLFCRKSLGDIESELFALGFYKAHRSYLLNMKKIKRFNKEEIEFPNGEKVYISQRVYKDFCKEYLKYE